MGAWNYGVFDDDTACDALAELIASPDIITDMEKYFDEVIQAEYVDYDDAQYALASMTLRICMMTKNWNGCDCKNAFTFLHSNLKL